MASLGFPLHVLELSLVPCNSVQMEYIGKHDLLCICQYMAIRHAFWPKPSFSQYPCDHHGFLISVSTCGCKLAGITTL